MFSNVLAATAMAARVAALPAGATPQTESVLYGVIDDYLLIRDSDHARNSHSDLNKRTTTQEENEHVSFSLWLSCSF